VEKFHLSKTLREMYCFCLEKNMKQAKRRFYNSKPLISLLNITGISISEELPKAFRNASTESVTQFYSLTFTWKFATLFTDI
jgi:hypothetical protein